MQAHIVKHGVFACFDSDLTDDNSQPINVEISAIAWNGTRLVFGSDKNIPGDHRSPVFALDVDEGGLPIAESLVFYTADLITSAEKYEDFALSDDSQYLIASTGFDRVDEADAGKDRYNRLLVWPCDEPGAPTLVGDDENDGIRSSVGLREDLSAALGAAYFKVEGLASIPGESGADPLLLFGIREVGRAHDDFDYVCEVVGAPYRIDNGHLSFTDAFEVIYEFDPSQFDAVRFDVGLSSLEYDPVRQALYFLTSFEVEGGDGGDKLGAYLWHLSIADFQAGRAPALVVDADGQVLKFDNKAEGVAVLPSGDLFVVYDPDRELGLIDEHPRDKRHPSEAPYTLLRLTD